MFNKAPKKDVHSCDVRPPAPKPKYIDALNKESTDTDYVILVKKDPVTGLLYAPDKGWVTEKELQEIIKAEENARKQAINDSADILNGEIEKESIARNQAIRNEREDRENGDQDLNDKIDYTDNRVDNIANSMRSMNNQLQNVSNMAQVAASKAIANEGNIKNKLSKNFDVSDANDIAEEDYFVINSGGNAYRITLAQLKEKIGNEGENVINNYLGDFNSETELKAAYPVAQEGNFAYVKGEDEIYAMYLWVDEDDKSGWYKSTSGKYVKTTTFDSFKEQLQNGTFNIGAIDEKTTYTNSTPTTQALGGIPKGTTFTGKPITEVLNMLLYPYVAFSTSISMSPKNGGTVKTQNNQTVTGCTVSITKGSADITKIEVKYGSTVKATKTSNIGTSNSFTFDSAITITSSSSYKNISVEVTDSTGVTKTASSSSFTFVDPYYYGVTTKAASELTINDILSMTESVESKGNKAKTYTMNQQRAVIAYPASYGNLSSIKDANNFEVLDTFNKVTISNNGVNYYVYVLDGLNTATMKYTFSY